MALFDTHILVYMSTSHAWATSPTWTEVTDDVKDLRITRGLSGGQFGGGTCQFTLRDSSGTYDPDLSTSTWYLSEKWRQVKVDAFGTGATTIFRGWTDSWVRRQDSPSSATVTVTCVDAVRLLAQYALDMGAQTAQWAPARVRLVANNVAIQAGLASWPAAWIEALDADGTVYVDSFDGGGGAWSHIQQVARAEGGACFVTRDGVIKLYGRHTAANNYAVTPTVIITDDGNASDLPIRQGSQEWRSRTETRRAVITTAAGDRVEADDTSANEVPETWTSGGLPIDSNAAQGLADLIIQGRSGVDPYCSRVGVQIRPKLSSGRIDTAAGLDLLDQVRVEATPVGQASQQVWDCAVVSVNHVLSTAPGQGWELTLGLEPDEWWTQNIGPTEHLRLDDVTYGQLDEEKLGY